MQEEIDEYRKNLYHFLEHKIHYGEIEVLSQTAGLKSKTKSRDSRQLQLANELTASPGGEGQNTKLIGPRRIDSEEKLSKSSIIVFSADKSAASQGAANGGGIDSEQHLEFENDLTASPGGESTAIPGSPIHEADGIIQQSLPQSDFASKLSVSENQLLQQGPGEEMSPRSLQYDTGAEEPSPPAKRKSSSSSPEAKRKREWRDKRTPEQRDIQKQKDRARKAAKKKEDKEEPSPPATSEAKRKRRWRDQRTLEQRDIQKQKDRARKAAKKQMLTRPNT